jgi:acyl-coenzyme A synthetase/AMP-(fatty) acid ligase
MMLYTNYILESIEKHANVERDKIAISTNTGQSITWKDLDEKINRLAENLIHQGFKEKDRVLFLVKPSIEAVIVLLGVVKAGGILITADPAMGEENFKSRVTLAKPKWVFCESIILGLKRLPFLRKLIRKSGVEIPEINSLLSGLVVVKTGHWLPVRADLSLYTLINSVSPATYKETQSLSGDVQITFTSGTTNKPKAVVHTSDSFDAMIKLVQKNLQPRQSDIFFTNQYYIALPALASGSTVVLNTCLRFNAKKYIRSLHKYQVTHIFDIPKNLRKLKEYCDYKNLQLPSHVATIITGSTPIYKSFLEDLQKLTKDKVTIWSVYGMTEILPISAITAEEKLAYSGEGDILGKPFDTVSVSIETDGELVVSGDNMCDRILGEDSHHQVHTGDICKIDDLGRIILLSRKKDMIIKSHYNIYPTLFESTITQIPGVKSCAMIGIYNHDSEDEDIVLVVVKESNWGNTNFLKHLQNNLQTGTYSIDQYALPDRFILLDDLPTSGRNQKINKQKLKELILSYEE